MGIRKGKVPTGAYPYYYGKLNIKPTDYNSTYLDTHCDPEITGVICLFIQ